MSTENAIPTRSFTFMSKPVKVNASSGQAIFLQFTER